MNKRRIRIAVVPREPIDLDRLAAALLALAQQLVNEADDKAPDDPDVPDAGETGS